MMIEHVSILRVQTRVTCELFIICYSENNLILDFVFKKEHDLQLSYSNDFNSLRKTPVIMVERAFQCV